MNLVSNTHLFCFWTILSSVVIYCPRGRNGFFVKTEDRGECGEEILKGTGETESSEKVDGGLFMPDS